ncbi:DUF4397 domain-containing protein [Idiomarina sp. HP20-50]|uniref:DUF4397 domain-containing protein n=1 Tax=Idiomarina sp. HP20-50 TaxID=3070813 RepID=UPI00294B3CB0|nr:DUF4397 domain-containing protein [Idiomarina sp. HP20-50]MDV6317227.1 DUF4397 domain-containing protein [Idiomarina sp. HP20-50]
MQGIKKLGVITTSLLLISGCNLFDSDDDDTTTPVPEAESSFVRVHHTSADSPNVNVLAGDSALLEDVPYHASSAILEVDGGDYDITVQGILPDGSTVDAIGPTNLSFAADTRYEVFAIGQLADASLEPLILSNSVSEVTAGESRIQVVHAAYGAPTVDVYLTAPDADLSTASATLTLAYAEDSGQVSVEAGDYRIRLTGAGDDAVVYDSGTVSLADGGDYIIAATNNVSANLDNSPVTLQVSDGEATTLLPDVNAGADVRVVHAVADAPNVDVTLNDAAEPQIPNLAFPNATGYLNLAAAEYSVDVAAAGGAPVVIENAALVLENATSYSVYAVGELSTIGLQVLTEERRRVTTAAQVQLVHAAPSAGNVDIYITETDDISAAEPDFADIPFNADALVSTGNVALTPGDYVVTVTATGTTDVAIQTPVLTLDGGGIYTAVAVDATSGGLPPQLILMDDLAN